MEKLVQKFYREEKMTEELYRTLEGKLHISREELAELSNEDYNDYPDVVGHVCESCDEENAEENMLEYEGSWWCRDCRPELKRCDVCGATYAKVSGCKECGQ